MNSKFFYKKKTSGIFKIYTSKEVTNHSVGIRKDIIVKDILQFNSFIHLLNKRIIVRFIVGWFLFQFWIPDIQDCFLNNQISLLHYTFTVYETKIYFSLYNIVDDARLLLLFIFGFISPFI